MPESPEVETIARNLRDGTAGCFAIPGLTISGFKLSWQKTLVEPTVEVLNTLLPGQVVKSITRRAKYLIVTLSRYSILIHLRMSGDLLTCADDIDPGLNHIRFELEFLEGGRLLFNDPRKFGRIWVVEDTKAILGRLGPEPLDESFTVEDFFGLLQKKKRIIKSLLLDQTFIAGLGNIYTDESLHLAGIHPLSISKNLNFKTSKKLLESIRQVLNDGIYRNGSSIDWVYRGGEYQNNFRVYGRTGQNCNVCGTIIERIVVSQRGTHLCPKCQVLYQTREKD
jgi:formamidopyrimidine-DNA glycosylase